MDDHLGLQDPHLDLAQSTLISDAGGYFSSDNVEGALQELGAGLAAEDLWDRNAGDGTIYPKTITDKVLIGTTTDVAGQLQSRRILVDGENNYAGYLYLNGTITANQTKNSYAIISSLTDAKIDTGYTESGAWAGWSLEGYRNQATDAGTLNRLYGARVTAGNFNCNASAVTNSVFGVSVQGVSVNGSIGTLSGYIYGWGGSNAGNADIVQAFRMSSMNAFSANNQKRYGLSIAEMPSEGAYTGTENYQIHLEGANGYGIYQEGTAPNYFAGALGIGTDIIFDSQTLSSISTGTSDNDKLVTQGYVDDAVSAEDLWDRTGTVLTTSNANDSVKLDDAYLTINDTAQTSNRIQLKASGSERAAYFYQDSAALNDRSTFRIDAYSYNSSGLDFRQYGDQSGGPVFVRSYGISAQSMGQKVQALIAVAHSTQTEDIFSVTDNSLNNYFSVDKDGKVTLGDGTNNEESVYFNTSTNTGQLKFRGSDKFLTLLDGSLEILTGDIYFGGTNFVFGGAGTGEYFNKDTGSDFGSIVFYTSNTNRFTIRNNGQIGTNGVFNVTAGVDFEIGGVAQINDGLIIGNGTAATDYTLTFDGETNDGVITWMEDEDYFKFDDDVNIDTLAANSAVYTDANKTLTTTMPTGAGAIKVTRLTGTTSVTVTAGKLNIFFCDTDGGAFTVNLPAGTDADYVRIINCGSSGNDVTVAPNGAELLTGANASRTLSDSGVIILTYQTTEGWW